MLGGIILRQNNWQTATWTLLFVFSEIFKKKMRRSTKNV